MLTPRPRPRIRILSKRLLKQATLGLGVASTLLILNPVQAQRNSLPAGYRAPSSYVQAAQTQAFKHQVRQNQGQGHAYGRQRQQSRWNQGQPAGWDQGQGSDIRGQGGRGGQGYCGTQVITCRPLARCGLETCQTCQSLTHDQRDAGLFDRMLIQGWFSIANCDYEEARETFKILRHENPSDPRPKIGLAIAQGLTSWEGLSARTMRKAVDLAPGILLEMPYSGAIQAKLRELLCKLKKRMKYDCANPDVLFMVGAIKTMLGDIEGADRAIHEAIEAGDCSISAKKLLDTLHRKQRCFMQSRQSQGQNRDSFRFDFNFD